VESSLDLVTESEYYKIVKSWTNKTFHKSFH
jgi:hypothetical protein